MGYNLPINEVYWGYNPFTNHLLTSWDIQVPFRQGWERTIDVAKRLWKACLPSITWICFKDVCYKWPKKKPQRNWLRQMYHVWLYITRWWFQTFFFPPLPGEIIQIWLIFFRWVGKKPPTSIVLYIPGRSKCHVWFFSWKVCWVNQPNWCISNLQAPTPRRPHLPTKR